MPAVRRPNWAGKAPVMKSVLSISRVSIDWPKPLMLSGSCTPLMRYCTLAWSSRTCRAPEPFESCDTPGRRSSTSLKGVLSPWPSMSIMWLSML